MKENERRLTGFIALALFVLLPVLSSGQVKDTANNQLKNAKYLQNGFVLVMPFPPEMYEASGDQYICVKSKLNPGQLSDLFRRSLTSTLMYDMNDLYNVVEPFDNLKDKNSDISVLYQIMKYNIGHKKLKAYYKAYPHFTLWQMLGPLYKRWGSDCVNNVRQKPNRATHKYVRATVMKDKDSIYTSILSRYDALYTLIITDFEMHTRFKNCLDLQDNVYQRDIFIHYTLLDINGEYVDGGVVGTTYQSPSNDAKKIIENNISVLTGLILTNIRNKLSGT